MTSTITPPSRLATLPTEILEDIALSLSQNSLSQCVCVSRSWNEAMTPHLWRTIPLFSKIRFKRFMMPDIQRVLYKNAVHVHETKVFRPESELTSSDDAFTIGPFTNLRVLELYHLQTMRACVFDEGIIETVRQNPGLRRLKIDIVMESTLLFSLVTEHVPNLQELDIETPWRGDVKALLDNLPEGLRTVRLNNVTHQVPREAQVISIGPNWTHIELYKPYIGPLTAAAIVDNCERLEVLGITGGGDNRVWRLSGSHFQAVLSKATRLRSLQARGLLGAERISSVDILSSEWATTSLEHVDFKINVPRVAADQEDADDDDSRALLASSRDIQRRVLRRFGQQTHLRRLVIGGLAISPETGWFHHQLQCLEMTLESGLDELEGLKELSHLDIQRMDHRVGVPELEWMVSNLPKLKQLLGMRDSWRPLREGVEEWLSSHQPTWL
ncbi:hypothetical protein BGX24_000314 [Mortierella sp. AD032]|nr:hypothetical protein BGX24_000314 [Mortierella sp. AD032]